MKSRGASTYLVSLVLLAAAWVGVAHLPESRQACSGTTEVVSARAFACFDGPASSAALAAFEATAFSGPGDFDLDGRWTATATNGGGLVDGQPTTLTWSLVPDGTALPSGLGEPAAVSDLDATMTAAFGTAAAWETLVQDAFDRWQELSGITFVHQPSDDGAAVGAAPGLLGIRGDIRIGAHSIDGSSGANALAFTRLPSNGGDIVLDSDNAAGFTAGADNFRFFRNALMHEIGHALGLRHVCPLSQTQLMEGVLSTAFDGPQDDDIRGIQRLYGDRFEDNDTGPTSRVLGSLGVGGAISIDDASLDSPGDQDWYEIAVTGEASLVVTLTPVGSSYGSGVPIAGVCGAQALINTLAARDLELLVFTQNGSALLAQSNATAAGAPESATVVVAPGGGTYRFRVAGNAANQVQRYRVTVAVQLAPCAIVAPWHVATEFHAFEGSRFGIGAASIDDIDGDGNDEYVVTSYGNNQSSTLPEVRVYSGATRTLIRSIDGPTYNQNFGVAVAGAGDVDGDGFEDIIVGEPYFGGNGGGRANVYSATTGALIRSHINLVGGQGLGNSVGGIGDINGDGRSEVIVGVPNSSGEPGHVVVYSGLDGSVLHNFSGVYPNERFGAQVGGIDDLNSDGVPDLYFSVTDVSTGTLFDNGVIEIRSGANGSLLIALEGPSNNSKIGRTVAVVGDVDHDGKPDIAARNRAGNGSVVVFSSASGAILRTFSDPNASNSFGESIAGGHDVDGDGTIDIAIGDASFDGGMSQPPQPQGRVMVFSLATGALITSFTGNSDSSGFGTATTMFPMASSTGHAAIVVGAPWDFDGVYVRGSVGFYAVDEAMLLDLSITQPGGPGSLRIATTCGTPGDIAFTAITTNPANAGPGFGAGWWSGLHISMPELVNQFAYGQAPFVNLLDGTGHSVFVVNSGVLSPLVGITIYGVTRTFDPSTFMAVWASDVESLTIN